MLSTYALETQVIEAGLCTGCGACQECAPTGAPAAAGRCGISTATVRTAAASSSAPDAHRSGRSAQKIFPGRGHSAGDRPLPGPVSDPGGGCLRPRRGPTRRHHDRPGGAGAAGGLHRRRRPSPTPGADWTPRACWPPRRKRCAPAPAAAFRSRPPWWCSNRALQEGRYRSIGVVGTPCKTLAVYKMKARPLPENDNHRPERIGMVFGLFCGWGLDWDGIRDLAGRYVQPDHLSHMDIPPQQVPLSGADGGRKTASVNLDEVTPLVRSGCHFCTDMTAEFADVSVGGARSADGWDVDKGWNQVVVRSEKGAELVELARRKGVLEFRDLPEGGLDKLKRALRGQKAHRRTQSAPALRGRHAGLSGAQRGAVPGSVIPRFFCACGPDFRVRTLFLPAGGTGAAVRMRKNALTKSCKNFTLIPWISWFFTNFCQLSERSVTMGKFVIKKTASGFVFHLQGLQRGDHRHVGGLHHRERLPRRRGERAEQRGRRRAGGSDRREPRAAEEPEV
jgi:coenzyme F420-reducing hydrogenase beta subunit